ncbi:tyrosine-type recombinase/integrase [Brachybacterium sp. J144]|uniref:tyrosine-type recombinase/integrase n=1 Tax=Brachybacterium sp. J144 TaxID=3116487 RepID=UPI002E791CFD|nr:tyrosine-type recombinase/integrase [Brachybacterium sp. J144]MEE1651778.1 tyrosine-type recombinase/integrase [Brachybacterium sp. J144]
MPHPADLARLAPRDLWSYYLLLFDLDLATSGAAETSRRKHGAILAQLREAHPRRAPWELDHAALLAWLAREQIAPATWRSRRATLRAFYGWAVRAGHLEQSPAGTLPGARPLDLAPAGPAPARRPGPPRAGVPARWREPLALFDAYQVMRGRPETTRTTRRQELSRFARHNPETDPWQITPADLLAYISADADLAPETRRQRRGTLRAFYSWALLAGHVTASPAAELPEVATPHPLPRPIPDDALADALDTADPRRRLILRLAAEVGLRRAEIAACHTRDLRERNGRMALLVHGKGARERIVPVPEDLGRLLATLPEGYLFPARDGEGHLTARHVGKLAAEVLPPTHTLHTLRHRFATNVYRASRDLYAVQRLLGHGSPTVTQRYVGLDVDELWSVVDAVGRAPLPAPSRLRASA